MKRKIKYISLLIGVVLFTYCNSNSKNKSENAISTKATVSKKDGAGILEKLKPGDSLPELDLSSQGLTAMPDLSPFFIRKLNLSNNKISHFEPEKFPKNLSVVNLSYNEITISNIIIEKEDLRFKNLKEINLSNNNIKDASFTLNPERIDLSNNNLTYLSFGHRNIKYLDISNNPNMPNVVDFDPDMIATVKRDNISTDAPLIAIWKKKPEVNKGYQVELTEQEIKEINENMRKKKSTTVD